MKGGSEMKYRIAAFCMIIVLFSALCTPSYVLADSQSLMDIADQIYETNLEQLDSVQQVKMQQAFRNIEIKMTEDPVGHLSMAYMAMVTQGADPKAQAMMAAWCVRREPEELCLINNLGFAMNVLKDHEKAEAIFKKALEIDGESLETIINLGNMYFDTERYEEAKTQYESALKIDGEYYKAWEGLYGYYLKKKDINKAMEIAMKIKPVAFIQRGRDKMQEEADAKSEAEKLEHVEESDSLEVMRQKVDRISRAKPLNVAPIVEEIDPAMAAKIEDEMGSLRATVTAPDKPWPVDFSNAKDHYITSKGYKDSDLMSQEEFTPYIDPEAFEMGKQIQGLSEGEIDSMVNDYLKGMDDVINNIQGLDMTDPSQLMEALGQLRGASAQDPFGGLLTPEGGQEAPVQAAQPDLAEQLGVTEKRGLVTKSNYDNYLLHKKNFDIYLNKIVRELAKASKDIGGRFNKEMLEELKREQAIAERLEKEGKSPSEELGLQWRKARNRIRDKYVQEFGAKLNEFYNNHARPAIEKVERAEALYIKNMANKALKKREAEEMRVEMNAILTAFANAKAPVDEYEPESSEASKQIQAQIKKLQELAPKENETLPQLKPFVDGQKSLLEELNENVKYECQAGLASLKYENGELTLGINDPLHNEYLDLGVNLIDQSISLTEGKGFEAGFSIVKTQKALPGSAPTDVEANVGLSTRKPGQKTTLYFDGGVNLADFSVDFDIIGAQITQTPGSTGVSAGIDVGDGLELGGDIKIETTAEGTSEFVASTKLSVKDWQVLEKQYREKLSQ
jgi:Tfp pilus assembly protein PilF